MNDFEPEKEQAVIPANILAKQGVSAISQIAGGILILVMHIFSARLMPLGILFGLVVGGFGISGLISKEPDDRKPGAILTIAGILKLVSHVGPGIVRGLASSFLTVASLGLLALGVLNGIKFLKGLKNRQ